MSEPADDPEPVPRPRREIVVPPLPSNRLTFLAVLMPAFRGRLAAGASSFPDGAPALIARLQKIWQSRHRGVGEAILRNGIDWPRWFEKEAAMRSCPPVGGHFRPPYAGKPCGVAGCPWCAAREAYGTYRAVIDACFPRREGGGRDRLRGANLWLRELSLGTRSYYTEDGIPRNGFLEALADRSDRDGPLNRAEEYRQLDRLRCGAFGFFERILPLHHALPAAWTLRLRQILLLPDWQDLPDPPTLEVSSLRGPFPDPSPNALIRAVAWAHRYNRQFLAGSPYHLLELGEVRSHGTLQMTAGLFRRCEDRLRPRSMPPQPRTRGRGRPRKEQWNDRDLHE